MLSKALLVFLKIQYKNKIQKVLFPTPWIYLLDTLILLAFVKLCWANMNSRLMVIRSSKDTWNSRLELIQEFQWVLMSKHINRKFTCKEFWWLFNQGNTMINTGKHISVIMLLPAFVIITSFMNFQKAVIHHTYKASLTNVWHFFLSPLPRIFLFRCMFIQQYLEIIQNLQTIALVTSECE